MSKEIDHVNDRELYFEEKLREAYLENTKLKGQIELIHATLFGLVIQIEKEWGLNDE